MFSWEFWRYIFNWYFWFGFSLILKYECSICRISWIFFIYGPKTWIKKIFFYSTKVYDWVKEKFHVSEEQIFIFGRSLGTSPSIYLLSYKKPKALFVVSAFKSIKWIGEEKYVSGFLGEIFNSIKYIKNVKCPILFIHGKKDNLISWKQSQKILEEAYRSRNNSCEIKYRSNMSHNDYDIKN